ncbi:MAG: hypothetical protein KDC66_09890 [Phaeodactylibacter sp.]|nr:hypothetical protein [Phaeodactylibacter sp.]MCB9273047.1 hypothetical protein [Lewinellaceae bacterium]
MARKKLTLGDFKHAALSPKAQKAVKGGYKYGPSGANFVGSFIWEGVDIRGQQILKYDRKETGSSRSNQG